MNVLKATVLAVTLGIALVSGTQAIAEEPTTVQLTLVHHYPIFSASIDGHRLRLLFDLGGDGALVLTRSALATIGIAATGPGHKMMDVKGNILESQTFAVPRLRIGKSAFTNVPGRVDVHAASYRAAQLGQQGYVGPSLFVGYRVVLDYRRKLMTLISPGTGHIARAGCTGITVPFLNGLTNVQTDFGDLAFVWDTGAPISFIRKALVKKLHIKVVRHVALTHLFRMNGADFGPLTLVPFNFSEPPGADGFIGANFYARHVVCLDFPGKRFLIQH